MNLQLAGNLCVVPFMPIGNLWWTMDVPFCCDQCDPTIIRHPFAVCAWRTHSSMDASLSTSHDCNCQSGIFRFNSLAFRRVRFLINVHKPPWWTNHEPTNSSLTSHAHPWRPCKQLMLLRVSHAVHWGTPYSLPLGRDDPKSTVGEESSMDGSMMVDQPTDSQSLANKCL